MKTILDIETGPLPAADLQKYLDEIEYTGVAKDPAKVAAALEEKKAEFLERAALSPETGRILAIGLHREGANPFYMTNDEDDDRTEKRMLSNFWELVKDSDPFPFIGHNLINFDLPFLCRRSWKLGVKPIIFWQGKPWDISEKVIDTMQVWACGEYQKRISLNNLARYFGLEEKTAKGDQFQVWWRNGERRKAIEYLGQDLKLTAEVAKRMGV